MGFLGNLISSVGSTLGNVLSSSKIPFVSGLGDTLTDFTNKQYASDQLEDEQEFAAGQAQLAREFNAVEAEKNRDFNSRQALLNRAFQTSEREAVQQFNLDMWNLNNEYNSPVEQLKRAQAAGINPNAVIGSSVSGSVSGGAVSSSPMSGSSASGSAASGPAASSPGSIASTLLTSDAVVRNLLAQADKTETESDINRYELGYNIKTEGERIEALLNSNDEAKARIVKLFSDVGVNDFNKELQTATFSWFARKSEKELEIMSEQLNELRNKVVLLEKQAEGIEKDNLLKQIQIDFSNITGFPLGAPAEQAMFKLYKSGKFQDFLDYSSLILSRDSDIMKGNMVGFGAQYKLRNMIERAERRAVFDEQERLNGKYGDEGRLSPVMNTTNPPGSVYTPGPWFRFFFGRY